MAEQVGNEEIMKGLQVLQGLAKGHGSKGTPSTDAASMQGQGGPSQLFHTPSNSDPGSWAGSSYSAVPENGTTDSISENGTDYEAQGKMMKSIMDKILKGQTLNEFEAYFMKSVMSKAVPPAFAKDKEDKEDVEKAKKGDLKVLHEDEDEDTKKSLADLAGEDETIQKGLEVSEFLTSFVGVMNKSLAAAEERIATRILKSLQAESERSAEFQKSLAIGVAALGNGVALQAQRLQQVEATPARGPKSAQSVQVLEKSLPVDSSTNRLEGLNKSQVASAMVELVRKGDLGSQDVILFESTGHMSPEAFNKVAAHVGR